MLLALDVGNTNITLGVFDGPALRANWRLRSVKDQTADELGIHIRNLFALDSISTKEIRGIIVASVVPPLDAAVARMARHYFELDAVFVTNETDTGVKILYDPPSAVGADRLVNAVAAIHKYGSPCVVVDMGTAITFDAISGAGEYLGGVIAAGIGISIEALFARTARLPLVDFKDPGQIIGSNTVASIQSGLYYGALGMIDGICDRLVAALGESTCVIATGGQAPMIARGSRHLRVIDEHLTLEGLELIWRRTRA